MGIKTKLSKKYTINKKCLKENIKLKSIENFNKEIEQSLKLINKLKIFKFQNEEIDQTTKAIKALNEKLLKLVSIQDWQNNDIMVEQVILKLMIFHLF